MKIIGIDPGQKGSICIMDDTEIKLYSMPKTIDLVRDILETHCTPDTHIFLEKAQVMPKNGVVGMAHYLQAYGEIIGVICVLRVPLTLVHPRTWCKVMHQGAKTGKPKARSEEVVKRLYPEINLMRTAKCTKLDEGFIDALLIAGYGKRALYGTSTP